MAPPTQIAYRTSKDIGVFNAAAEYASLPGFERPEGNLRCCAYSPCGRFFAWADPQKVNIIDADTAAVVSVLPADNVFELGFSPLGTYVITWQRPSKDETTGDAVKNLKIWRVVEDVASVEKETVGKFVQKSQTGWNLQYTFDEKFCARVVTNEVQIYESHDLRQVWNKLRVEGVTDFAVSPGEHHSIAVFVPERKGQPAAVRIYNVPNFTAPVSQKNFFKGDKVQLKWNNDGSSLLVLAQTEVDKTGKSYYGETTLYLLSSYGGFDSRIDLDKEGPVHEVAWSPKSTSFAVVYGYMPAKTVIFNARAHAVHTFPLGPRNYVSYSPHGRFLLVAGFGNLQGQMDIYDLDKDFAKICMIEASNASICEWSPDGRHILTATTSPRLRVDNGMQIWHAAGQLMYNQAHHELYHVCWRPQSPAAHPLGPAPLSSAPEPHPSATAIMATKKTPSKPVGAYRPPGARGQVTPLAFKREDEGGAVFVRDYQSSSSASAFFGKPKQRIVPGAETLEKSLTPGAAPGGSVSLTGEAESTEQLSKTAKKNAKKREARKAAAAAAQEQGEPNGLTAETSVPNGRPKSPNHQGHQRSRSKNNNSSLDPDVPTGPRGNRSRSSSRRQTQSNGNPVKPPHTPKQSKAPGALNIEIAQAPPVPTDAPALEVTSPTTPGGPGSATEKKIRGLLKKIRAIDDLKMRHASGEKLEDTQIKKISSEDQVRKELTALGYSG